MLRRVQVARSRLEDAMYIEVKDLKKSYGTGDSKVQVLRGVTTEVEQGKMCVIQGTSGSGKSTLLNCIGGLDTIDSGSVVVNGTQIAGMTQDGLAEYRRANLGFIFQFYNLVPNLTVRENIQVCQYLTKQPLDMDDLLETLGLSEHQDKFPSQLSGGQQQRCAIARALIKNPALLLCDEPTGALDYLTGKAILALLREMCDKYKMTVIVITHNSALAPMADRVIHLKNGKVDQMFLNEHPQPIQEIEW